MQKFCQLQGRMNVRTTEHLGIDLGKTVEKLTKNSSKRQKERTIKLSCFASVKEYNYYQTNPFFPMSLSSSSPPVTA